MKRGREAHRIALQARLLQTTEDNHKSGEKLCDCGKLCTCGPRLSCGIENSLNSPPAGTFPAWAGPRRHTDCGGGQRILWDASPDRLPPVSKTHLSLLCTEKLSDADTPDSACDDTDGFTIARRRNRSRPRLMSLPGDFDETTLNRLTVFDSPRGDKQQTSPHVMFADKNEFFSPVRRPSCLDVDEEPECGMDWFHRGPASSGSLPGRSSIDEPHGTEDSPTASRRTRGSRANVLRRRAFANTSGRSLGIDGDEFARQSSMASQGSHLSDLLDEILPDSGRSSPVTPKDRAPTASVNAFVTPSSSQKKLDVNDFKTPVLHRVNSPSHGNAQAAFPCYRPLEQCKTLHVIRHGESEYNAACHTCVGWGDPLIFDPHLTALGRDQAAALRNKLEGMPDLEDAVWMVSPLTRAIETFLLACPFADKLRAAARGEPYEGRLPRVIVCPEMHEHSMTAGDIGRPASVLMGEFPEIADQLSEIPEVWWYTNDQHPNSALDENFAGTEVKPAFQERVEEVRKMMLSLDGSSFVAVGHSMFWKEFLGRRSHNHLKNCEVHTTHV